jgi:RNA polymerase sigma-70 factor (ECF subfamily)
MARPETVELAKSAMKGNRQAFDKLCEKKSKEMLFTAKSVLGNLEDAEDATQETILLMCRDFGQLRKAEAVDAWIYRILMNRCATIFAKRKKVAGDADIDDEAISIADDDTEFIPEKYAEDKELGRQIYEIVMELPLAKREAVLMYYYDGLSHKEIAGIRGVTERSVSSLIAKARTMIRNRLEKIEGTNAMFGIGVTAPVLSRILEQQASEQIPDQILFAFQTKYAEAVSAVKFSPAKNSALVKIASIAVLSVIVFGGAIFAQTHYLPSETASATVVSMSDAGTNPLSVYVKSIDFAGGECECGHQNPKMAAINGDPEAMSNMKITWDIRSLTSGQTLFAGDGAVVSHEFAELEEAHQTGRYSLVFHLEDESLSSVTMERVFEIL